MSRAFIKEQRQVRASRAVLHRRRTIRKTVLTVVVSLVLVFLFGQLVYSVHQDNQLHHQNAVERVALSNQERQKRHLQGNVRNLNNKEYLEQLIRERFYYSKPGETVYSLPNEVSQDVTQN